MENFTSIFGIKFGISKEDLFKSLEGRYYYYSDHQNPSPNSIIINWIEIAGRKTDKIIFNFFEDKLCSTEAIFDPQFEEKLIEEYSEMKNEISNKYFKSENDYFEYEPPHYPTDDYYETIKALEKGHLKIECWWNFSTNTDFDNYIILKISPNEKIHLKYAYTELNRKYIEKLKTQDY